MTKNEEQLQMWQDWQETGEQTKMTELLTSLTPLLKYTIRRYDKFPIPYNVLLHHAMQKTRDALGKYDPNKGQINTYITNQLRTIDRFVKSYQNLTYLPEYLAQEFGRHSEAQRVLEKRFDRSPTVGELAKHMKITPKHVERIEAAKAPQSLMGATPEIQGGDILDTTESEMGDALAYLREELGGSERKAFDYLSGHRGKPMSSQAAAEKLKVDIQRIYLWRRKWSRLLAKHGI